MLQPKAPVVAILGHVDHGKTSLLDKIRRSNLVSKEPGQITQAIGAYQVTWKGKRITFLDTPGHEAFTNLRSRGAQVADIAVLVVAADDGVMSQTKEAIKIIKQAKIPFLVAINKIDLPTASVDKVKGQLVENEVLVEGYGGDIVCVPVSAKTGQGIDQLLEMIQLMAEMEELKADPEGIFKGVIIESKKDRLRGPIATVLVKNGTLKIQDEIMAEEVFGRVKTMNDENRKKVFEVFPGQAVQVLGFTDLPPVGAEVTKGAQFKEKKKIVSQIEKKRKLKKEGEEKKLLKIILKTDCSGSLEAILGIIPSEVEVIFGKVGDISESEVLLAKTFSAVIFGFNIKVSPQILKLAETEKVKIKNFNIIYDLLKEIDQMILKIMEPTIDREVLGKAQIIAQFEIKGEKIAGAKVLSGRINKDDKICLERDKEIVGETKIKSIRHGKEEITQVEKDMEFGVTFNPPIEFQIKDIIVAWQ